MIPTTETTIANALIDAGINEKISVQEAKAFLTLLPAATDGWTFVPKSATADMIKAGRTWSGLPAQTWTDMIDAAPASPVPLPVAVKDETEVKSWPLWNETARELAAENERLRGLVERAAMIAEEHAAADLHLRDKAKEAKDATGVFVHAAEAATGKAIAAAIRSALSSPVGGMEGKSADVEVKMTEAQQQAQAALDKVMNCHFSNFDAGAVIHWAERGMYQLKAPASFSPTPASDIAALREENGHA